MSHNNGYYGGNSGRYGGYGSGNKRSGGYSSGGSSYRSDGSANNGNNGEGSSQSNPNGSNSSLNSSGRRSYGGGRDRDYYSGYRNNGSGNGGGGNNSNSGGSGGGYGRYDQYSQGGGFKPYKSHGKSSYIPGGSGNSNNGGGSSSGGGNGSRRRNYDRYDSYPGTSNSNNNTNNFNNSGNSANNNSNIGGPSIRQNMLRHSNFHKTSTGSQSEYRRNLPVEGGNDFRRRSYNGEPLRAHANGSNSNSNSSSNSKKLSPAPVISDPKLLHLFDDEYVPPESKKIETKESGKGEESKKEMKSETNKTNKAEAKPREEETTDSSELKKEQAIAEEPKVKPLDSHQQKSTEELKFQKEAKEDSHDVSATRPKTTDTKTNNKPLPLENNASAKLTTSEEVQRVEEQKVEVQKVEEPKVEEPKVEESKAEESKVEESKIEESKVEDEPNVSKSDSRKLDKQIEIDDNAYSVANSSMLSPVGDGDHLDDPFFNQLGTITESKESTNNISKDKILSDDDMENVSEAETIITNSPPRVNKARRLVRKLEFDREREDLLHRKKTRRYASESEHDDDDEDDHKSVNTDDADDLQAEGDFKSKGREYGSSSKDIVRPYKMKRDSTGRSLLQRACGKGSLSEVKNYIERGADPNESDYCGFTCLHEAALEGHSKLVEYLISKGADVNKQAQQAGDLETPLIDAAENKHLETVKVLIANGADPRVYNLDGFTALTKIYNEHDGEDGYQEIIKVLEEANSKFADKEEKLQNPSSVLAISTHSIVEDPNDVYFSELLKKKNLANSIYKYAAEGLKEFTANYFVEGGSLDHKPDILILAARNGHIELVDIILGLNPGPYDINQENSCGITALVATVGRGHSNVVESLLSKGADPSKVRKQDGLNCLEIAQRAIHYDAKEVKLLQDYMKKTSNDSTQLPDTKMRKDSTPKVKNDNPSDSIKKRKIDDDNSERKLKKVKSRDFEKESSAVFTKEKTPEPSDDLKRLQSRELTLSPKTEEPSKSKVESLTKSPSPAPVLIPLTKEQEEQKARSVEETRQWQEKVEAKKRARRDMFLRAEKEKERKRKEDEERRALEEKESLRLRKEEEEKRAIEEVAKAKELNQKRQVLEREMIRNSYPIGLQTAKFGLELTTQELGQYCPLYTFAIDGHDYVVDLQIALLTGSSVSSYTDKLASEYVKPLGEFHKSKLWNLFYPMIGIDREHPFSFCSKSAQEGHEKFKNLLLQYIRLDQLEPRIRQEFPQTFEVIWNEQYKTPVDIETLLVFSDIPIATTPSIQNSNSEVPEIIFNPSTLLESKFVPPRLRRRADVLKTLQNTSTPLW